MAEIPGHLKPHVENYFKAVEGINKRQNQEEGQRGFHLMKESAREMRSAILKMVEAEGASKGEINAAKSFLQHFDYNEEGAQKETSYPSALVAAAVLHQRKLAHLLDAIERHSKILNQEAKKRKMLDAITNPLGAVNTVANNAIDMGNPKEMPVSRYEVENLPSFTQAQRKFLKRFLDELERKSQSR